jgi:hypothetical protein
MKKNSRAKTGRVLGKTAAAFLNLTRQRVHRLGSKGVLRYERVGRLRLYFADDVVRLKKERETVKAGLVGEQQLAEMMTA